MEGLGVIQGFPDFYEGKRVFVTGHTGFKGGWLVTWLLKLGATVKGYALDPEYSGGIYDDLLPSPGYESEIGDIRNKELLSAAIGGFKPDIIFHLAAQPLVRKSYVYPVETFETNVIGTVNVLDAARHLNNACAIIIITTDKVYQNLERDILYKETDLLGGFDPYSASKACCELVVNSYRSAFFQKENYSTHLKSLISARAGNVIGGGDWSKDRIIPDIIRALISNSDILVRNPNSIRPWQHVLEPLYGYLLLGIASYNNLNNCSNSYNFGPEEKDHLTVKELVTHVIETWGAGNWYATPEIEHLHEAGILKLDITKARNELQWTPKLSAIEAIEWTVEWYKQHRADRMGFTLEQVSQYMKR